MKYLSLSHSWGNGCKNSLPTMSCDTLMKENQSEGSVSKKIYKKVKTARSLPCVYISMMNTFDDDIAVYW